MSIDPAVQSVRVAVALCDRFLELLKGPSSVTAAKRNNAFVGVSGNDTELSLRIGEAQQIYPEIWRHLDEARAAFASRGVLVSAYDTIRAAEGAVLGANVQVSYTEVAGRYGHQSTTKEANFNREGVGRARTAYKSLMEATPDIDWAAIAKAEANDPAAAAFGRATRNRRYIMLGALALVIGSPFLYVGWQQHQRRVKIEDRRLRAWDGAPAFPDATPLGEAQRAALRLRVTQLQTAYDTALESWATTMSPEALAATEPGTQPCSTRVDAPAQHAADTFIQTADVDDRAFVSSNFTAYKHPQVPVPRAPLIAARNVLTHLDRSLESGAVTATVRDQELLADVPLDYLIVVIDRSIEPAVTATAPIAYKPGTITGRGYVYSVRAGKVTCAAAIAAVNPPPDPLPPWLANARRATEISDVLHRQLEIAIRQELARNLRAVP